MLWNLSGEWIEDLGFILTCNGIPYPPSVQPVELEHDEHGIDSGPTISILLNILEGCNEKSLSVYRPSDRHTYHASILWPGGDRTMSVPPPEPPSASFENRLKGGPDP